MIWSPEEHHHFKDHASESGIFTRRVVISMLIVLLIFSGLIARFYILQVTYHKDYLSLSDQNRIQVRPKPPNRGLIFDRHGEILAENRPSFTLSIIKEQTKNLEKTIDEVATIVSVSDTDRKNFDKALKQRRRPYQPIPLRYKLTQDEIALIAVNKYRLKGVKVDAQLVRHYPFGDLFAHTIGYVGRINERELNDFSEKDYARYAGTHSIGKIGLEKFYEKRLLGRVGNEYIETNAHGRILKVIREDSPKAGRDLHLHLDRSMQAAAYKALGGRRGAVVAIDVKTGGILTMLSAPTYDPNLFVTGISYENYQALYDSIDLPLFNRTTQGQYPAGSTLKPMLGLGGLHHKIIEAKSVLQCHGSYQLENDDRLYRDWKKEGHGVTDLYKAIVESCDVYFYDLAFRMGVDRMHQFGDLFGLGKRTGIDVPSERPGLWPSRDWKRNTRGLSWYPGNSLNMSIGQGDVLTTPLQLAVMTATLATRGERFKPHLVKQQGKKIIDPELVAQVEVYEEYWDYVDNAMQGVVHGRMGTAKIINKNLDYLIAGKTGTAQVVGIPQDEKYDRDQIAERLRDHALFVGYAPASSPQVAVAVIVENGEHGSKTAAPIARKVFDEYFVSQKRLNEKIELQSAGLASSEQ